MNTTKLAFSAALAMVVAGTAWAGTTQINGETLAEKQEFTYRLLDDIKSFDPHISTDVEGFGVSRQLFEGLMNEKMSSLI